MGRTDCLSDPFIQGPEIEGSLSSYGMIVAGTSVARTTVSAVRITTD